MPKIKPDPIRKVFKERSQLREIKYSLAQLLNINCFPDIADILAAKYNETERKLNDLTLQIERAYDQCVPEKGEVIIESGFGFRSIKLHDADPNCRHIEDRKSYSGIKCKKCNGWYCV